MDISNLLPLSAKGIVPFRVVIDLRNLVTRRDLYCYQSDSESRSKPNAMASLLDDC